jgi:O-antigen/teichoic acid export membrane protein
MFSIKKRLHSKFIKQVFILTSGTVIAQLISVGIIPVLTRLYSPEEFGIFAIFSSIVAILGVFATGRYEYAILADKSNDDAWNIFYAVFILSVLFSIFVVAFSIVGREWVESALNINVSFLIIYMAGFSIFLGGIYQASYYWLNRQQYYHILTRSRVVGALILAIVSTLFGFLGFGAEGLIAGMILGQVANLLSIYISVKSNRGNHIRPAWSKIITSAKQNLDYPRFLIPSSALDRFSSHSHILLLSYFFGTSVTGALGLYQRVVALPIRLIGNSIADVFKQHASVELNEKGECLELFYSTAFKLFLLGIIPFVLLLTVSPIMFEVVFGPEWRIAGEYAQTLSWMFFFGFVVSPLSSLFFIARKQKFDLIMQVYLLVSTLPALYIGHVYEDMFLAITLFTISYCIKYIIEGGISWKIAAGKL